MKKTRYYMALIGVLTAAAVSVTACQSGSQEVQSQTGAQTESQAEAQTDETKKTEASAEKPAFQTITAQGGGSSSAEGDGTAKPITGAAPKDGEKLSGIPVDAEQSEAVSIYYGSVCYSYFSEDKEKIQAVADLFTGFSLEEVPQGQLDEATTYQIYFSTDTEQIAAINVDKSGMFYLPEEKEFYKVKTGTFHFETLDQIYKDSMYADGFDENQCLIK